MAEYIEREKLRQAFLTDLQSLSSWDVSLFKLLMIEIDEAPSADVAPVRHGRWVKEKTDVLIHWHCSACEECFFLDKPNSEYCPHCGAKMDEKEDT